MFKRPFGMKGTQARIPIMRVMIVELDATN